ncbi:hypothetical protein O181_014918 [Austropuccinia psidii MF-1]|uniref:Uncharacterized protein n=1 Tax=Austropuccinia psidii MF-1 TaxID=1389203 RepID=A0A9Q3C1G9_9BASI|nr:hypothetical protein [Austropuccinia psidii MF-1]
MHVHGPNASNPTPYAGPGSQCFCLTLHMRFLQLGQVLNASHTMPYAGPRLQSFTCKSICRFRFAMLHMQVLMPNASHKLHKPILTPTASHAIAYAGPHSQCFT